MRTSYIILSLLLALLSGCTTDYERFEEKFPYLDQMYGSSSDIIIGEYVAYIPVEVQGKSCNYHQQEIRITDSLKGSLKVGQRIKVTGLQGQELYEIGSSHLLFLAPQKIVGIKAQDSCRLKRNEGSLNIQMWCCALVKNDDDETLNIVMYDMVNSEQKSENYLVPAKNILKGIRTEANRAAH